jgi:hypothetical protein
MGHVASMYIPATTNLKQDVETLESMQVEKPKTMKKQ